MGGAASKPEDIAKLASSAVDFQPPLGPPNPVRFQFSLVYLPCKPSAALISTEQHSDPFIRYKSALVWYRRIR